jgi:CRISPR-associated endoribonuclease Cas6
MVGKFPVIIQLKTPLNVKGRGGETLHGFLLSLIADVDSDYASYLHNLRSVKPFSISPIFSLTPDFKIQNGKMYLNTKSEFRFIINSLNLRTLEVLIKAFVNAEKKKKLKIGEAEGIIKKICLKENEGAIFLKYEDILKMSKVRREVEFKVLTPLSFRKNGNQVIFPEPSLFFKSLKNTFNAFSPIKIPGSIENKFEEIGVSKFSLHSEMWEFSNYKIIGCTGRVKFVFEKKLDEEEVKFLNALCLFANFSGVGYKRTMGMGMVEVQNVEKTS